MLTAVTMEPLLVQDIAQMEVGSSPRNLIDVAGTLFFSAETSGIGRELWMSDGTPSGTSLVKDIIPGPESSWPYPLGSVGNTLYFTNEGVGLNGQLWKTDGTVEGTLRVDIGDRIFYHGGNSVSNTASLDGRLFFIAQLGEPGVYELWVTDGTDLGTHSVKAINPEAFRSEPAGLIHAGDKLYFTAKNAQGLLELWSSDGTGLGTFPIHVGDPQTGYMDREGLVDVNGTLFFKKWGGQTNGSLWKTDGTPDGAELLMTLPDDSGIFGPDYMTNVNGTLFFKTSVNSGQDTLWKSDGTVEGTTMIDLPFPHYKVNYLTGVGDILYFTLNEFDALGHELWMYDQTVGQARLVKDISPGPISSFDSPTIDSPTLPYLTTVNGVLYFTAFLDNDRDPNNGFELWRTDGTEAGTQIVKDINAGLGSSTPQFLTDAQGALYFTADDGASGRELWLLDTIQTGDVDRNGNINSTDIDRLFERISAGDYASRFDLNGDSQLGPADVDTLVGSILGTFFGDADLDGQVGIGDLTLLAQSFGQPAGWAQGDFNGDGQASIGDLILLAQSFGQPDAGDPTFPAGLQALGDGPEAAGAILDADSVQQHIVDLLEDDSEIGSLQDGLPTVDILA